TTLKSVYKKIAVCIMVTMLHFHSSCTEYPVFTPSALVVKYGDPANVTCDVCQKDCSGDVFGLEHAVGKSTPNGTTMLWTVDRLTEWDIFVMCYYNADAGDQCSSTLDLTLYRKYPPESVSISFVNHTGMMFENQQYTLQCSVQNVAPVQSLTVTFYRGNTALAHLQSKNDMKKPVNESFTLNINSSREYNGAQYWCEAKLKLGPAGPQRPPVVTSEKLRATVFLYSHQTNTDFQHTFFFLCLFHLIILSLFFPLCTFAQSTLISVVITGGKLIFHSKNIVHLDI
uniref:Ig-like domain-containing protein n=1 Tax=Oreochromis niloticus TaxID=8128 RepID=I3J9Z1_ORENI